MVGMQDATAEDGNLLWRDSWRHVVEGEPLLIVSFGSHMLLYSCNLPIDLVEGLFAVEPNEERSGDAFTKPAEEKDPVEAQETEDRCGENWAGTFFEGDY